MLRVFRYDGKEMFINPDNILFVELMDKYTSVTMVDGKSHSFSETSYEILTGRNTQRGPGRAGFDVI